jgi:hypothetical protein
MQSGSRDKEFVESVEDSSVRRSVQLTPSDDNTTHIQVRTPAMKKQGTSSVGTEFQLERTDGATELDEDDPVIQFILEDLPSCGSMAAVRQRGIPLEPDNFLTQKIPEAYCEPGSGEDPAKLFSNQVVGGRGQKGKRVRVLANILLCHSQNPDFINVVASEMLELPQNDTDPRPANCEASRVKKTDGKKKGDEELDPKQWAVKNAAREEELKESREGKCIAGWKVRGNLGYFLDIPVLSWLTTHCGSKPALYRVPDIVEFGVCPFGCRPDGVKRLN